MEKSKFWRICDCCGASDIKDWESHIKECPKIPQKEKEILLEMGKGMRGMKFEDYPIEVKNVLKDFSKSNKGLYIQLSGVAVLIISFMSACIREHIATRSFDLATILGIFMAMATTPLFWIGLGLEEWGRIIKKKLKSK